MTTHATESAEPVSPPSDATGLERQRPAVPPGIQLLIACNLLLGLAYVVSVRGDAPLFFRDTRQFWALDDEANLPSWYSSMQMLLVAALLGALAARERRRHRRAVPALVAAAALFLFLSADEGALLHERAAVAVDRLVVDRDASAFPLTGIWMFLFGPALLVAVLVLAWSARHYLRSSRRAAAIAAVGVALLLACAAGVETLANFVAPGTRAHHVQVLVEEVGEMTGATLILWGTWELARRTGLRISG